MSLFHKAPYPFQTHRPRPGYVYDSHEKNPQDFHENCHENVVGNIGPRCRELVDLEVAEVDQVGPTIEAQVGS